jgi:uncharacterized protein YuzE
MTKIRIQTKRDPIVELDSEARAAYVRFSSKKVARTQPISTDGCVITADFDSADEVIGIEIIGVEEFSISKLMKKAGFSIPVSRANRARYVSA